MNRTLVINGLMLISLSRVPPLKGRADTKCQGWVILSCKKHDLVLFALCISAQLPDFYAEIFSLIFFLGGFNLYIRGASLSRAKRFLAS